MKEETMHRLTELDDIHLQIYCAVESVRQSYEAMTQGTPYRVKMIMMPCMAFTLIFPSWKNGCLSGKKATGNMDIASNPRFSCTLVLAIAGQ